MKLYAYKNCSTCKSAAKWLHAEGIAFEEMAIRETPPSAAELKRALAVLGRKRLFNTSGQDYRALGLKDKVAAMSDAEVIELLAGNGNLIKRPLVLAGDAVLTGFSAEEWAGVLKNVK